MDYTVIYREGAYFFETNHSVAYRIKFADGTWYFKNLPAHILVFEFKVKVLSPFELSRIPYDKHVETTIVKILTTFLNNSENNLLYVCDITDNRQLARHRKFNGWFKKAKLAGIEKYDLDFTVNNVQTLASLIVHHQNPDKDLLVKLFFNLRNTG